MKTKKIECPFCAKLSAGEEIAENDLAFAILDGFPVSPGHTVVLPRRHIADYSDLFAQEKTAVWRLVDRVWDQLAQDYHPDGFNLGLNVGTAAGQTVLHAHVHVIPRYLGDSVDPRGGIRWVLPARARYWSET